MKKLSLTLTFAVILMFVAGTAAGATIYVDADANGANDGSSWTNAYNYLQDALADPCLLPGSEIWVAEGIYYPDANTVYPSGTGDRTATFQLKNGVGIYSSYAGYGAADPNERDVEVYVTILKGDLNDDDGPNFANNDENSYHVVTGGGTDATAILDGFTITAGDANGSPPDNKGAGMHNNSGSPTVTNCTFSGNRADHGINGGYGSGMFNDNNSCPTVTNCTFSGNFARSEGGGMCNQGNSNPMLTDCTFIGNSAGAWGGGMYNFDNSDPNVTNCTFSDNEADQGGGMKNGMYSSPTLTKCTFTGNEADFGGGMCNENWCSPTLTNCTFNGNSAAQWGGGMYNEDWCSLTLTNCTFSGNWAATEGGRDEERVFLRPDANQLHLQQELGGKHRRRNVQLQQQRPESG